MDGGTVDAQPEGDAPVTTAINIIEPGLSAISKVGRNITRGDANDFSTFSQPDAGDILEYRLNVTASSGATHSEVFDLLLTDTLPTGVTYQAGSSQLGASSSVVGVAADNNVQDPDIAGQVLTWGLGLSLIHI